MIINAPSINTPQKDIIPLTSPVGVGNSISNTNGLPGISAFVKSQFPEFVSVDHPAFITFMEAYYSWLDSRGQPLHEARRLLDNQDIDTVEQEYEEHLFEEFLSILPRNIAADKSIVLKNIKQFYGAKGTEKSFKFLFRILFNSNSYLYYPKVDILRTSDGKWIQNQTIRLTNVVGDITRIRAQKIRGVNTNTVAFVERFYGINFFAAGAYELVLNASSITGSFEPGEGIVCTFEDGDSHVTITGNASPLVTKVTVIKPGRGYKIGDLFKVQDTFGEGAIIRVSEVDENGSIISCNVKEYGIGYNVNFPPSIIPLIDESHPTLVPGTGQANTDVAEVKPQLGATTKYGGYFRNSDGQVSTNKYIHDGFFYQQFSYVTFTDKSYNEYKDVMNKVVHPIGFKHFGGIALVNQGAAVVRTGQTETPVRRQQVSVLPVIAKTKVAVSSISSYKSKNNLGPSYESIIRDKFSHKPFIKYDANREILQDNPPYYGTSLLGKLASTPVSTFELNKVGVNKPKDLEGNRIKRIRLFPDSYIIQNSSRVSVDTKHNNTKNVVSAAPGATTVVSFEIKNETSQLVNWQIRKNGVKIQEGTSNLALAEISASIIVMDPCRLALYVTDDLNREYKSDDVRIKVVG